MNGVNKYPIYLFSQKRTILILQEKQVTDHAAIISFQVTHSSQ